MQRLVGLAQEALSEGRLIEAVGQAEAAVRAAQSVGDSSAEAGALVVLGQARLKLEEPAHAAVSFERALLILEGRGDQEQEAGLVRQALGIARAQAEALETPFVGVADPEMTLGAATQALASGSPEEALSLIREGLPVLARSVETLSMARAVEARALQRMGHLEEALGILEQAIATALEAGLKEHVDGLRGLERRLRQTVGLRRVAAMSVEELTGSTQDPAKLSALLMQKALTAVADRDKDEARRLVGKGREAAVESGKAIAMLQALVNSAQIYGAIGDVGPARAMLEEARPLAQEHSPAVMGAIEEIERGLRGQAVSEG